MLLPRRLLPVFDAYIAVERAAAVAKFAQRRGWEAIDRPIFIHSPSFGQRALHLVGGGTMDMEVVTRMNAQGLLFALMMERRAKPRSSG